MYIYIYIYIQTSIHLHTYIYIYTRIHNYASVSWPWHCSELLEVRDPCTDTSMCSKREPKQDDLENLNTRSIKTSEPDIAHTTVKRCRFEITVEWNVT